MKKGEIYEGIIEKVDFPNKGYVLVEDQKILIKNGIPGQKVRFMIQKKRAGRVQGRILEVLEKSTRRQGSRCAVIFRPVAVYVSDHGRMRIA